MTTSKLILCACKAGLTVSDFDCMTVGMILDVVNDYIELTSAADSNNESYGVREATEKDFKRFANM